MKLRKQLARHIKQLRKKLRKLFGGRQKTSRRKRGDHGESLCCKQLKKDGYKILERNFKAPRGELDIVASDGQVLAIIEVKTRSYYPNSRYGSPAKAVDQRKRRCIKSATAAYLRQRENSAPPLPLRYDIMEVLLHTENGKERAEIHHLKGAFQ